MESSDEHWKEGSSPGHLNHLIERMANDFTPHNDGPRSFQPGFIPSASPPPWSRQVHIIHGSQIPSHAAPFQLSSGSNSQNYLQSEASSGIRSYSVSQDLYSDLGNSRSPLLRSSSDLGVRLNHYEGQSGSFIESELDEYMDSSVDSLDGMLLGNQDHTFFPKVQRSANITTLTPPPTIHMEPQHILSSQLSASEFSFYSNEHDRIMHGVSVNNITTKLSNFTASLGSWFGPFDPFRSNIAAPSLASTVVSQGNVPDSNLVGGIEHITSPPSIFNSSNIILKKSTSSHVYSKPSYSDVLSKNTSQELKATPGVHASISSISSSSSSNSNVNIHPPPSSPPGINNIWQEAMHNRNSYIPGSKVKNQNSNSASVSISNSSVNGATNNLANGVINNKVFFNNVSSISNQNSRNNSNKNENLVTSSRVGLDSFDFPRIDHNNGCLSAYEHYDWGEATPSAESISSIKQSGSSKKQASKGEPNKIEDVQAEMCFEIESVFDKLNNRISPGHQKQLPRRTSYINNNLNNSGLITDTNMHEFGGHKENISDPSTSAVNVTCASSVLLGSVNNNNNEHGKVDTGKGKWIPALKEEKKPLYVEDGLISSNVFSNKVTRTKGVVYKGNDKVERSDRVRENQSKKVNQRRRKELHLGHTELLASLWVMTMLWVRHGMQIMSQALSWLLLLIADVVEMSGRLAHDIVIALWAITIEKWQMLTEATKQYWQICVKRLTKNVNKDEKKIPGGRERKLCKGLDCNISLPTTGEEAMKRLLACKGKDPYSILGVTVDCTDEDIKKYYKRQAFLVHPDKNKQPGAEEAFKILAHAFEIIGEPDRRSEYDARLAEEVQLGGAWGELANLLARLQEKLDEAANTIRCTNCNKRHRRTKLPRPTYAARYCQECQIHHASREGDIWAESTLFGLRWQYYACMECAVYDISDWAACQSENLKHLQANTHSVQYRIVSGKKTPPSKYSPNDFPSDPDLEEFFNNLCKEKFGKDYTGGTNQPGSQQTPPDMRKRKGKKKK